MRQNDSLLFGFREKHHLISKYIYTSKNISMVEIPRILGRPVNDRDSLIDSPFWIVPVFLLTPLFPVRDPTHDPTPGLLSPL